MSPLATFFAFPTWSGRRAVILSTDGTCLRTRPSHSSSSIVDRRSLQHLHVRAAEGISAMSKKSIILASGTSGLSRQALVGSTCMSAGGGCLRSSCFGRFLSEDAPPLLLEAVDERVLMTSALRLQDISLGLVGGDTYSRLDRDSRV